MFDIKLPMKATRNCLILMIPVMVMMMAVSCQSGQKGSRVMIDDAENKSSSGGIESFNQIYHLYPSPAEMLSIIDITDLSFEGYLLNPLERADQYVDSKSRTYVLGVYLTDLAYAAIFGRHEETLDYLDASKSLAEEININDAVDESIVEKARNNLEFLDSLYTVSNDAFINILNYCERNERSATVVELSAGAFVESLYLAVNMIDDYNTADQLLQHLTDQKYTIDNFMLFAKSVDSGDSSVESTINDLAKIKSIFDGIQSGSGEVSVRSADESDMEVPKKLVIGGSDKTGQSHLSEEDFEALKSEVIELRNRIVEGKL